MLFTPPRFVTVSALGLCQLIAFGTSLYLLTSLSAPIVRDTGWPLDWVIGGYSAAVIVSATVSAIAGRYVGAGQGRMVLATSALLFAAGLGLMALAHSLPVYCIAWAIIGLGMGGGLYDTAFGTAGRLYGQTARASIIQIALWGGFASTVFWPLSHLLEAHFGWRTALLVFAGMHLCINLPLYLFLVPRPHDAVATRDMKTLAPVRLDREEWPLLLLVGSVVTLEMSIVAIMSVHMQALLTGRGLSLATAVTLSAMVGPSQVLARLLELTLGRRWPAYLSLCVGVVGVTAGVALIAVAQETVTPGLILYGAGLGVVSITSGTVPLAIFGPQRYPPLMGQVRRISILFQAVAPTIGALALAHFGAGGLLLGILGMAVICLVMGLVLARRSHDFITMRTGEA